MTCARTRPVSRGECPPPQRATFSPVWPGCTGQRSSKSATRPAPGRSQRHPEPAGPGRTQPSRGKGGGAAAPRAPRRPAFSAQPRACAALPPERSSGHPGNPLPATCPSGPLPALDCGRGSSPRPPAASSRPPREARRRRPAGRAPTDASLSARLPLPASTEGRAAGRSGGDEGGRQRSGGSAPALPDRGREGRCRPAAAAAAGPGTCPRRRPRTPRRSAPRPRRRPARRAAASAACGPSDVLPPRRRQRVGRCLATPPSRPAAAASPANLGRRLGGSRLRRAGAPPSRHPPPRDAHPRRPASLPAPRPPAPTGEDGDGVGPSCGPRSGEGRKVGPRRG